MIDSRVFPELEKEFSVNPFFILFRIDLFDMRKYKAGHIKDVLANIAGSNVVTGSNLVSKNALSNETIAYGVHDIRKNTKL